VTDTAGRTFVYTVDQPPMVVSPSDVAVLNPTPYAELTLTTCNPRFSATSRLVVVAKLTTGEALPAAKPSTSAGSGGASGGADNPTLDASAASSKPAANLGSGDSGAWPAAIAFGLLVLLLWVGVRLWISRTRSWHRVAAFGIGIGICLVPLWLCFENAILLLPQSI
jgi:hypothetical protein